MFGCMLYVCLLHTEFSTSNNKQKLPNCQNYKLNMIFRNKVSYKTRSLQKLKI